MFNLMQLEILWASTSLSQSGLFVFRIKLKCTVIIWHCTDCLEIVGYKVFVVCWLCGDGLLFAVWEVTVCRPCSNGLLSAFRTKMLHLCLLFSALIVLMQPGNLAVQAHSPFLLGLPPSFFQVRSYSLALSLRLMVNFLIYFNHPLICCTYPIMSNSSVPLLYSPFVSISSLSKVLIPSSTSLILQ